MVKKIDIRTKTIYRNKQSEILGTKFRALVGRIVYYKLHGNT